MRKFLLISSALLLIFGFVGIVNAAEVTFDFNSLPDGANAAAISTYMTGLYGSTVTVAATGAPAAEGGLFSLLGPDRYIESEPFGVHTINITFATPISSVSFDWGSVVDDFYADANGQNFFHDGYNLIDTGSFSYIFATPVTTLSFHDSYIGEVGIDNLKVNSVPEPTTLLLLGSGLLGLVAYGRNTFRK